MNDLLNEMQQQNKKFTGNLRSFGNYILKNPEVLMHRNIEKIAKYSGTSPATIYRYIKRFGYSSYEVFIQDYLASFYENRRPVKYLTGSPDVGIDEWSKQHFQLEIENIAKTNMKFSPEKCHEAAQLILNARRRWVVGWRLEASAASYMAYTMNYMLGDTAQIESGLIGESLVSFKPQDILVVMSFQRYSSVTLSIMEKAQAKGLKIIVITDSEESPAVNFADVYFIAETSSLFFLDSYTAALAICNALTAEVSRIGREKIHENLIYQEMYFDQLGANTTKMEE